MDRYAHYGNLSDGFAYYLDKCDLVEVSDTVYFDRQLSFNAALREYYV